MNLENTQFFERRINNIPIDIIDRRKTEQRSHNVEVPRERRRLAFQVRRYDRFPFEIPINIQIDKKWFTGYTHNISTEGLSVISDVILTPNTSITLEFSFGNVCNLKITGEVVSCRENAIRIRFYNIQDWEKKILAFSIQELKQYPGVKEQSSLNIIITNNNLLDKLTQKRRENTFRRTPIHASMITGWGSYLPPQEITAADITAKVNAIGYKNVGDVVEALTGIKSRRYAESEIYPSDLAALAARDALINAGMDSKDLDVIIYCGIARDFDEPATAVVVQDKIGAKNAYAFDLTNACNGFVSAIDLLDGMISSGRCENGLVVSGEKISIAIDWEPKTKRDFKLNIFSYTIGDAGGAAILNRRKVGENRGVKARWFSTESSYWRLALAGTLEGANDNNKFFRSEGLELERASINCVPRGFEEITQQLNWTLSSIDLFVPHQIPLTFTENLYHKTLGIPHEKLLWSFPEYGNIATASMPVAMCEAIKSNRVKPDDKILFVGVAAGFSVGLIGLIF